MSLGSVLLITEAKIGRDLRIPYCVARNLESVEWAMPAVDAAIVDVDSLKSLKDTAALCEFLCAVRYRAAWHRKPIVAVASAWNSAHCAEQEHLAVCGTLWGAVKFLESWFEAEERKSVECDDPYWRVFGIHGPEILAHAKGNGVEGWISLGEVRDITMHGTLTPGPGWKQFVSDIFEPRRAAATTDTQHLTPETILEREVIDLTLMGMAGGTECGRRMARDLAAHAAARLPEKSEVAKAMADCKI